MRINMQRRQFLNRLCGGIVGACVIAQVPVSWVPGPVAIRGVLPYLTSEWNKFAKGKGPVRFNLYTGQELFDAFSGEINCRQQFNASTTEGFQAVLFKGSYYRVDPTMSGWDVRFEKS